MKKIFTLILVLIFQSVVSFSQTNCPCCTENHKQFDFWVEDWIVYDTSGKLVGENMVVKLEDNCIINEHWRGAKGGTGSSCNYYDNSDTTWNQLWIDNSGKNLILKGKYEPGKMILKSKLLKGKKVTWYYNRISWTANKDGSVTQRWDILDKDDNLLTIAFLGIYKKR